MNSKYLWISYLAGALLTLVWKWARWCVMGEKLGKSWRQSTHEWFDTSLAEDKVSWGATIGATWVLGTVYIGRLPFLWDWTATIPLHYSIAFLLGSLMEFLAPAVCKWVLAKFETTT